jgi:hypothetical protein
MGKERTQYDTPHMLAGVFLSVPQLVVLMLSETKMERDARKCWSNNTIDIKLHKDKGVCRI